MSVVASSTSITFPVNGRNNRKAVFIAEKLYLNGNAVFVSRAPMSIHIAAYAECTAPELENHCASMSTYRQAGRIIWRSANIFAKCHQHLLKRFFAPQSRKYTQETDDTTIYIRRPSTYCGTEPKAVLSHR